MVITTPCRVSYPDMVRVSGGKPALIARANFHAKLRPDALEAAITQCTTWLISNPRGAVYCRVELLALAEVLRRHADALSLAFEAEFATMAAIAPDLFERTLIVYRASKAGRPVGYGGQPLALASLLPSQTSPHATIPQDVAIERLSDGRHHIQEFASAFRQRRDRVIAKLNQGLSVPPGAQCIQRVPSCAGVIGKRASNGKLIETDTHFQFTPYSFNTVAVVLGRLSLSRSIPLFRRVIGRRSLPFPAIVTSLPAQP